MMIVVDNGHGRYELEPSGCYRGDANRIVASWDNRSAGAEKYAAIAAAVGDALSYSHASAVDLVDALIAARQMTRDDVAVISSMLPYVAKRRPAACVPYE